MTNKMRTLLSLLIVTVSAIVCYGQRQRSYSKCDWNYDCVSCMESSGQCVWSVSPERTSIRREWIPERIICSNISDSKFGTLDINRTVQELQRQRDYSKAMVVDFCDAVNSDYANQCSSGSRNSMETCLTGNETNTNCAWDMEWSLCVNKHEKSFHPNPKRFIYRLDDRNQNNTVSLNPEGNTKDQTGRLIRRAGGKVIMKVAGEKIARKVCKKALKCIPIMGAVLALGFAVSTVAADPCNTLSWGQAAIHVGTSIIGPVGVAVDIVGCTVVSVVAYNNGTRTNQQVE